MTERALPNEFREEAERYALLPYSVVVMRDKDSDGNTVYLAINPELDGCMSDGATSQEAIENLREARADYIQVLLLSGERVPPPSVMKERSVTKTEDINVVFDYRKKDKDNVLTEYTFKLVPLN